jgi:glycosyltransferase involved in cell wall biosynthesis
LGIGNKAVVSPNAVDAPEPSTRMASGRFRVRYPHLSDRRIVLFLSRLDSKKGLDILLQAFARVRQQYPDSTLVVAGSGEVPFVSRVREQAARLGLASDVVWAGFLTGDDKWAALADADIFVLPSYSENFGVAVVEAMSCGAPVIISDQVAIHREITAAGAGFAVSCTAEAVAQALMTMLADDAVRKKMGTNGYHLTRTKFSSEASLKRLIDLYQGIAAAKSSLIHPAVRRVPLSLRSSR